MAELHITSLSCILNQDGPGLRDSVSLQINGTRVSGPHSFTPNGLPLPLDVRHLFTGTVAVYVIEEDSFSSDDLLGTVVIDDSLADQGTQVARLHDRPHSDYHMEYHVHP
jgi:hypothetical protein